MYFEQPPLFRKIIIPWYDTKAVCIMVMVFLFFVFIFSITGIMAACEKPEYQAYVWMPVLLSVMSGLVIFLISVRLIKRYR